jgi:hypothetical protein
MVLPSIPLSPQAIVRALCDGTGTIVLPTDDGPEVLACDGCRSCTSRHEAPSQHSARALALAANPFHGIAAPDDEPW